AVRGEFRMDPGLARAGPRVAAPAQHPPARRGWRGDVRLLRAAIWPGSRRSARAPDCVPLRARFPAAPGCGLRRRLSLAALDPHGDAVFGPVALVRPRRPAARL